MSDKKIPPPPPPQAPRELEQGVLPPPPPPQAPRMFKKNADSGPLKNPKKE